ncbi:MAG: hypothetical protein DMG22_03695, partial [Acidobacteria bacterium]
MFTIFEGDLCYSWDSSCTSTGSSGWKYAVNNGSPGNGTFNITFPLEGNHDTNASLWDSYWNGHSRATVTAIGGSNFNYYSGDSENRTYSFDYGNSHFCLLDNQGGAASTLSSGQISWLDSDIAAAEARGVVHTFINTHGPIWPINELLDTPSSSLIAVINKHPSISASLSAHEHVLGYAHIDSSRIAAVTHPWEEFVSGGAGAPLFSCTAGLSEYCTSSYGFVSVDVSGSSFTVNLYLQGAGSVPAETWTFTKPTAAFTLTPTSVSFGNQTVGTTSAAQAITVNNGTASSVSISSIAITGTNSGDFTRTTNCGSSLAAGAQCAINVTFKPTASGSRTAAVTVTDSATGSPQTATLSGTGVTSTATLSPTSLTFGSQPVGATSTTQAFTLTNSGNVSLAITSIAISGDFAQTNNCGTSVAAGANCTINMTFTPTATGTRNGTLTVTDNATNSPQTASLTGTGTTSTAALAPTSLTFASQQVGSTSLAQAVALTNSGTTTVSITTIAIAGANPGDFGQTNNCGNSLAVEGNCTINVTFSPSATGTRTATLMVADNASNSPQTASLSGTGVSSGGSSAASLSPPALNFGNQQVSVTTPAQAVPLSNSGSAALSITSIAITGTNGADFAQTNNCGNSVAAGVTCTISVTFTPAATGTRSGTLTVTDNATNSPQTASLTGTGTTAGGSGPALVQVQNNIDTSGAAFGSFSVNITTNAGDFLVAFCRESSNGTDNFTVTDSAGQTWAQTSSGYRNEGSTGPRSGMFYVANSAAVNSVTVNYTTTGGVIKPGIVVFEISGAVTSGVADSSVSNGTASTTTSTSGSLTTTNANDLLIFATDTAGNVGGWAAGAGYLIPNNKLTTGASGSNVRMAMQYAVVTSTQTNMTTLMTYTGTNWNGNIFAAFKVTPSTGGSPSVNLLPSSMTFAGQTVGSTSAVQAIALQNGTSSSLTLSSIAISGTNSGDFAQTNNCGSTLAAGASCSIDVTFTPVAAGKRSGTLTVTDTATNSP